MSEVLECLAHNSSSILLCADLLLYLLAHYLQFSGLLQTHQTSARFTYTPNKLKLRPALSQGPQDIQRESEKKKWITQQINTANLSTRYHIPEDLNLHRTQHYFKKSEYKRMTASSVMRECLWNSNKNLKGSLTTFSIILPQIIKGFNLP